MIAQLNEGRASKKRATEFSVDQVSQAGGVQTCAWLDPDSQVENLGR